MRNTSRILGLSAAVVALAVAGPASVAAQAGDAAYDRVARAWGAQNSLAASFEQRITNPLLGRTLTSKGTFQQLRPNKVAITFTDPVGDRIVNDGKSLWVYLPSSTPGQVLKLPGNADGAVVVDLLGQLLEAPRKSFTITGGEAVTIEGRATRRVQLVPRTAGSVPFQKATLWLDEKEPRPVRVQVLDPQGIDRTITLTSWAPNTKIDAKAFRFSAPKGVKVLTNLR